MNVARFSTYFAPDADSLQTIVQETLSLIDTLQQGPLLPETPVTYHAEVQPFGRYVPGDGRPKRIELSRFGPHPHLTFAHEVGHLLDHTILSYNGYASMHSASPLREVMSEIQSSGAYQALQAVIASAGQSLSDQLARRRALYWSGAEELWARAYSQWVAIRSGSEVMLSEIEIARTLETHAASAYVQWEDENFALIAVAIDVAFR